MPSSYTTSNRLEKQATGENTNSWGTRLNAYTTDMLDESLDGRASYTLSGTKTLTSANGTTDEARKRVQHITGGTGGTVTVPAVTKSYFVINEASASVYFTAGGVQAEVPTSCNYWVHCDGTDCYTQTPIEYAAAASANYKSTSATSLAIGTGAKSLTVDAGKTYQENDWVKISYDSTHWMYGTVTSYNAATGALVANITDTSALGGTYVDWDVGLSGLQGADGDTLPTLGGNAGKSLRVATGETSTEWVDEGWVQIATASPAAVASYSFTAISSAYTDLYLKFNPITQTDAIEINIQLSADSAAWSSSAPLTPSTAGTYYGGLFIRRYNDDAGHGQYFLAANASPYTATGATTGLGWRVTGGVDGIKILPGTGTMTGTLTLYGRR